MAVIVQTGLPGTANQPRVIRQAAAPMDLSVYAEVAYDGFMFIRLMIVTHAKLCLKFVLSHVRHRMYTISTDFEACVRT